MTLLYLPRENLFHDIVMAVLFQVHSQEEPIEYSHRERKAELHLKHLPSLMVHGFVLTSPHIRSYANVALSTSSPGGFLL